MAQEELLQPIQPQPTALWLCGVVQKSENPTAVKAALTALSKDGEWLNQNTAASADFMVKELKVSKAVAEQATKNRGPESYAFPTASDITNLQKTADWL